MINNKTGMPINAVNKKKLEYPIASTMVPEYPPRILGNSVINELKIAYCVAVNDTLVRLDKKATNAALASPADKLSADITTYSHTIS